MFRKFSQHAGCETTRDGGGRGGGAAGSGSGGSGGGSGGARIQVPAWFKLARGVEASHAGRGVAAAVTAASGI